MENKLKVVLCDLDGTLALFEKHDKSQSHYRSPYDASTCENDLLNHKVNNVLKWLPINVILLSGREDKYRHQTVRWLDKHGVKYAGLFMRPTGDNRKDSIVKEELYRKNILPFYEAEFVFNAT